MFFFELPHSGLPRYPNLGGMVGLEVPSTIVVYGIAIKEPETFSENLSAELTARLPQIVKAVAAEELLEHCKPAGGT